MRNIQEDIREQHEKSTEAFDQYKKGEIKREDVLHITEIANQEVFKILESDRNKNRYQYELDLNDDLPDIWCSNISI